jgi:DNA-binding transcriptional MerR regulator
MVFPLKILNENHYDEIGLLKPASYGDNGYRYYGDEAVPQLQQILFFKELDFNLEEIRSILSRPDFEVLHTLEAHKAALLRRAARLERLIHTIDKTTQHMKGKQEMKQKEFFEGFSEEKQKQYEQEIRQRYGERAFEDTTDWNSYTPEQKTRIKAESEQIYRDLVSNMDKGYASPEVQQIIARWHHHLRYFYEPTVERLRGLGQMYTEHPDFVATFTRMHHDLPKFLQQAIEYYCKNME